MMTMVFKIFILIMPLFICCSAHEINEPALELDASTHKFLTAEDQVIWYGKGCPTATKYDSKKFDLDEKNSLIATGLEYLKSHCDVLSNEILARYYDEREEYPKSLLQAFFGAEKGSNYCMSILRRAYANGLGVVEDQIEASKWMYLAAALGNKEEKKLLGIIDDLNAKCSYTDSRHEEGRKRAQEWMEQHLDLFLQK